jgi:hypothetical protein
MWDALAYAIGVEVSPSSMMELLVRVGVTRRFLDELEDLTPTHIALLVDLDRDIVEAACAGLIGASAYVVGWNVNDSISSNFLVVTSFQLIPTPCSLDMIPRQSFNPEGMSFFRKTLGVRGPVREFVLTCPPDIPSFHPSTPSKFLITAQSLARSTSISSKLPLDIIQLVFDHLQFATSSDMEPPWWIPFDPLGLPKVMFLNDLALVCHQWVIPARRVALHVVPLYLTEAHVCALVGMLTVGLNADKYQRFVRHLYVSFSYKIEALSVDRSAALMLSVIQRCPNLQGIYMDNVPEPFITRQLLARELISCTSLTSFGFRAIGYGVKEPQDANMELSFAPPAPLYLPAMSNIQHLFLAGIDLQDVNYPLNHTIFRSLHQLHLHWTRPSGLFIRSLVTLPNLQRLHVGLARVEKSDLERVIIESPSLKEVTHSVLMESGNRIWDLDDDDDVPHMRSTKNLEQLSHFPYQQQVCGLHCCNL